MQEKKKLTLHVKGREVSKMSDDVFVVVKEISHCDCHSLQWSEEERKMMSDDDVMWLLSPNYFLTLIPSAHLPEDQDRHVRQLDDDVIVVMVTQERHLNSMMIQISLLLLLSSLLLLL
jgi:hypothetical protein